VGYGVIELDIILVNYSFSISVTHYKNNMWLDYKDNMLYGFLVMGLDQVHLCQQTNIA